MTGREGPLVLGVFPGSDWELRWQEDGVQQGFEGPSCVGQLAGSSWWSDSTEIAPDLRKQWGGEDLNL